MRKSSTSRLLNGERSSQYKKVSRFQTERGKYSLILESVETFLSDICRPILTVFHNSSGGGGGLNSVKQTLGCILNLKFIFPPPPLDLYFCPNWNLLEWGGARRMLKFFYLFFCNVVYFKSIGEKICKLFTNWGKIWMILLHK